MTLRDVAQGIADYLADDEVLHDGGNVTVVVEDKAVAAFEIAQAIAQTGVCVLVAVTDFRRVQNSPLLQGTLSLQITCYENPELNRGDLSTLTAQGAMERIVEILHYARFPFLANQVLFSDFSRDDVREANVLRGNFTVNTVLGYGGAGAAENENNEQGG